MKRSFNILKIIGAIFVLTMVAGLFSFGEAEAATGVLLASAPALVTMEQKDLDNLVSNLSEKASEKINNLFGEAEKGSKDAMTELKAKIAELSTIDGKGMVEYIKSIQTHANALESQIKEHKAFAESGMSFEQKMVKDIEAQAESMRTAVKSGKPFELNIKSAINMSVTDSVGAGVIAPVFVPGITGILKRRPAIYELLNKVPWTGNKVYYNQILDETGDPAFKKERADSIGDAAAIIAAARSPKRSYRVENKSMDLQKIMVHTPFSIEMLENIPDFVSWVQNELLRDLLLEFDTKLLTGTGTAPEIKGLQHADFKTTAAVPGDYKLPSGVTVNEAQALRAIVTQMSNGYLYPTAILMHGTDIMKLDLSVDKNGTPILYPFAGRDNTSIKGVPIVDCPTLTEGTFHIIDGGRIPLYVQRNLNIRIWDQIDDDPLFDQKRIAASLKAAPLVKSNEKIANIYGNLATVIAAMTASSS